ncbi:hypothetical protein ACFE04_007386 [Oxalis oulophora]
MTLRGYIYRCKKPVHWSPLSRTALVEAELEYPEGHVSRSIYDIFKMVNASPTSSGLLDEFFPDVCLAMWTTTSPNAASDLVPTLEAKWGVKLVVRKTLTGADLENCRKCPVVIGGEYITMESGTGLVHTAPGHGQEDYVTGLKYGLPFLSHVDDDGNFTEEAGQFSGLHVLEDGNIAVAKCLDEQMSLIMEESYNHKYPYDWRTKKPTIFRATVQWFASVEGFCDDAMGVIGRVKWFPPQDENRISTMASSRLSDWCISRQRTWVPIPVFYHVETKEPLMNEGSSWAAVLGQIPGISFPVDLYLEGTAVYASVVTHGFVLDEKGSKMSKYVGNVVDLRTVIEGGKNSKKNNGALGLKTRCSLAFLLFLLEQWCLKDIIEDKFDPV